MTHTQGPIYFDKNGIRDKIELRVLQYRTTYLNGTPILGDLGTSSATLDQRLRQIDVAYIEDEEKSSLKFLNGSSNDIWPSINDPATLAIVINLIYF